MAYKKFSSDKYRFHRSKANALKYGRGNTLTNLGNGKWATLRNGSGSLRSNIRSSKTETITKRSKSGRSVTKRRSKGSSLLRRFGL